jgi:hypothetical protein
MSTALIENDILVLLDSPPSGEGAPSLAHIEDALTGGYARTMALEAEQWRLQRRIADVAVRLADDEAELPASELRELGRELRAADSELIRLRALLRSLRTRAEALRAV